jgi:hypothetical protein
VLIGLRQQQAAQQEKSLDFFCWAAFLFTQTPLEHPPACGAEFDRVHKLIYIPFELFTGECDEPTKV